MANPVEIAVFAYFTITVIGLGLLFSLKRSGRLTTEEMFLGSRTIRMLPLALSSLSSIMSSTGIISFSAHFYAYGIHIGWTSTAAALLLIPFTIHVIIPVLYKLKITSVFEYLRARYCKGISFTACVMYFILTQSTGAVAIYAAAMATSTIFQLPFLWSCIAIGMTGTIYTTLGGLRGVVWTDSMQALVTILAPATIIVKIIYDSQSGIFKLRPLKDFDFGNFVMDTTLDFTKDENAWSCLIGLFATHIYRSGMDQMIVQRYLASRTLEEAKRTARFGMVLISFYYASVTGMGILIIYWFRDCDPQLSGAIKQLDQLLPFYVKKHLAQFPGFSGLFLAGVVSAATSTISSIINSQAAVLYTDVVSQNFTLTELQATRVTICIAFAAGSIMTLYGAAIPYVGSVTRMFVMVNSATTGPFVGLFLMALIFPCVNSKGAGTATLLMIAFQFWLMYNKFLLEFRPLRIPVTLNNCPGNYTTLLTETSNATSISTPVM
ncbi:unnamed protein product [Ixodes pacificus]